MPTTITEFIEPYRITKGKNFKLKDHDPSDIGGLGSEFKTEAKEFMQRGMDMLTDLQDKLYAQDCWAVLLIFQAMDAAGKDGAIKHVMSGVNPQGVQVHSFKSPSTEELDHDYLWRTTCRLPERGRIGIFNRSYYEELLVVKVHPEYLEKQHLHKKLITEDIWEQRYEDIAGFERYLSRNGVCIRKFFLNVSKKEQKKRFLARLDRPEKNWKFSGADIRERKYWDDYMDAYEQAIQHTATKRAPWFVVPADNKWFTRLVVMAAVVDALQSLGVEYPTVTEEQKKALELARTELE
jgi:PPK2 family polyphosphate:nucleotide phosphotransferase